MSGYWWLSGKAYLRERRVPEWLNKDACVPPELTARYEEHYAGPDRALPLLQRPQFSVEERERRILDLRCTTGWSLDNLAPFFLISRELADTIQAVDADALYVAECDIASHRRAPHGVCLMADARLHLKGWTAFDRARSHVELNAVFDHQTGVRNGFVQINGVVHFKPEMIADSALFRVQLGPRQGRVCVSDRLAEAIFAQAFLGLELVDASGDRRPPDRYAQYKTPGWEDAYPA